MQAIEVQMLSQRSLPQIFAWEQCYLYPNAIFEDDSGTQGTPISFY